MTPALFREANIKGDRRHHVAYPCRCRLRCESLYSPPMSVCVCVCVGKGSGVTCESEKSEARVFLGERQWAKRERGKRGATGHAGSRGRGLFVALLGQTLWEELYQPQLCAT